MLIATLKDKSVTPKETYLWAGDHGHLSKGHGTNYTSYFQKQFAMYGIDCTMLNWQKTYGKPNHANHDKAVEKLKEGYYAIALMGPGTWTKGGHFIVVWWQDNKVRINDPASTKSARLNGDIKTFRSEVAYYWLVDARDYNNPKPKPEPTPEPEPTPTPEEDDIMTGEEIYNALNAYLADQELPEWAKKEFNAAVEAGITDGTNPMQLVPRYQAAMMANRALEAALSKS